MANARLFSAAANATETQQACKECTPLERKARRDAAKKSRLQEKEQLLALDEEATKSGLEKPWIYRLSLFVLVGLLLLLELWSVSLSLWDSPLNGTLLSRR